MHLSLRGLAFVFGVLYIGNTDRDRSRGEMVIQGELLNAPKCIGCGNIVGFFSAAYSFPAIVITTIGVHRIHIIEHICLANFSTHQNQRGFNFYGGENSFPIVREHVLFYHHSYFASKLRKSNKWRYNLLWRNWYFFSFSCSSSKSKLSGCCICYGKVCVCVSVCVFVIMFILIIVCHSFI